MRPRLKKWAGRRGLMDRETESAGSNPVTVMAKCFFWGGLFYSFFFFFPHHVSSLSQCLLASEYGFYDCARGKQKEN